MGGDPTLCDGLVRSAPGALASGVMPRPYVTDVEARARAKQVQANQYRRASEEALAAQRAAVEKGRSLDARNFSTASAINLDKSAVCERLALEMLADYRKLAKERADFIAHLLKTVVDHLLPTDGARALAAALIAGALRNARSGEVRVSPADVQALEAELLRWAEPQLRPAIEAELRREFEQRLEQRVEARLWQARAEWEAEREERLPPVERDGARPVAGHLQVELEEGYGEGEGRKGAQPFIVERPAQERGPRREDYKTAYAAECYGGHPSEFG